MPDSPEQTAARIKIKRIYDAPAECDGYRALVDRLWPRGVRKDDARLDAWLREVAPSADLRRWFGHDPERWEEFRRRYRAELAEPQRRRLLADLLGHAREGALTLLYGARDTEHNDAVVVREALVELAQEA